jgi:hypothetical protein
MSGSAQASGIKGGEVKEQEERQKRERGQEQE